MLNLERIEAFEGCLSRSAASWFHSAVFPEDRPKSEVCPAHTPGGLDGELLPRLLRRSRARRSVARGVPGCAGTGAAPGLPA